MSTKDKVDNWVLKYQEKEIHKIQAVLAPEFECSSTTIL